ncbi:hypothetical protein [Runella sp.]|uniref:hypothetical protein n=1 Tax=Runella sp. TaxID=1960881 RepID=UPI00261E32B2|nr:hypothetical protein [Runella sp.]
MLEGLDKSGRLAHGRIYTNNGSVQIKGLYFLNRFANKLLERGAIEPQLLRAKLKKTLFSALTAGYFE